jgi:GlpG protein
MRMIGTLNKEEDAATFSNYLLTLGIDAHIEESQSGNDWQVWVEHDDHLDKGRAELDAYRANAKDPRFNAASEAARIRRERDKAAEKRRQNYTDVRTKWSGAQRYGTPVAIALILISVAASLLSKFADDPKNPIFQKFLFDDIGRVLVEVPDGYVFKIPPGHTMFSSIGRGEVWRLVTPIFLHGSPMHLLFNMMWIWQLGRVIESIKGSKVFLFLVLVTAIVSCSAEAAWAMISPFNPIHWTSFVGMSGVVGGLFGYAWMKGRYQPHERIGVSNYEIGMMLGWFAICTIGLVGAIANTAHWFGLFSGMAIVVVPRFVRRLRRR